MTETMERTAESLPHVVMPACPITNALRAGAHLRDRMR
jgi:hypothetical protein